MTNNQEIPKFLFKFINFTRSSNTISAAADIGQTFYFNNNPKFNDHVFRTDFFRSSYLIAKKILNLRFRGINLSPGWVVNKKFETEQGFLSLSIIEKERLVIPLFFDMPVYWYNNETDELGKSVLPGAFEMTFMTSPHTIIFTHFNFAHFSNHIHRAYPFDEIIPKPYYFEPAAKMNRELMRNFALSMKENYPDLIVELITDRYPVYPRDDFGFLDGADFDFSK